MCFHCNLESCMSPQSCPDHPARPLPLPACLPLSAFCTKCRHSGICYWPANWKQVNLECPKCRHHKCVRLSMLKPATRALVTAFGFRAVNGPEYAE